MIHLLFLFRHIYPSDLPYRNLSDYTDVPPLIFLSKTIEMIPIVRCTHARDLEAALPYLGKGKQPYIAHIPLLVSYRPLFYQFFSFSSICHLDSAYGTLLRAALRRTVSAS